MAAHKSTTTDPMDLHGQDREAQAHELKAREARRQETEDLKWLTAHPQGRRIVMRLLERTGVNRTSFNHSGSVMAFNEGRRDIGLFLTAELIEAAPKGYFELLKEYRAKNE